MGYLAHCKAQKYVGFYGTGPILTLILKKFNKLSILQTLGNSFSLHSLFKDDPGHLTNTLFEGYTDQILNFPSLLSDWSMVRCVHIIDQSEKSEVVKLSRGALSKTERHPAVMSKQGKRQNSKVDQCDLQKMYL